MTHESDQIQSPSFADTVGNAEITATHDDVRGRNVDDDAERMIPRNLLP